MTSEIISVIVLKLKFRFLQYSMASKRYTCNRKVCGSRSIAPSGAACSGSALYAQTYLSWYLEHYGIAGFVRIIVIKWGSLYPAGII